MDYDTWFDYLRLLESEGDFPVIREAYEKAIAQLPPIQVRLIDQKDHFRSYFLPLLSQEKRYWRRYIYLWINYALFEELEAEDVERTRDVYKACLNLIPHKKFTFAKIWLYYAQFELRQKQIASVRKILVKDSKRSFLFIREILGNRHWNVSQGQTLSWLYRSGNSTERIRSLPTIVREVSRVRTGQLHHLDQGKACVEFDLHTQNS